MSQLAAVPTAIYSRFNRVALDAGPAVDVGGGVVGIPSTGHGFATGENVVFNGTTNYDSTFAVLDSSTANQINITSAYTAEIFTTAMYAEHQFYNAIGGRLRHVKAKQKDPYPYCVFWLVTDTNEFNFSDQNIILQYQFDLHDQNNSSASISTIQGYLEDLYDDCDLIISGWRALAMVRDFTIPRHDILEDAPVVGYSSQFTIEIERLKT